MVDKEISNEKGTGKVILKITCVDFIPLVLYFALICARNYRRVVYTLIYIGVFVDFFDVERFERYS